MKSKPKQVFVHPLALVDSENIGPGTRIWAFTHVAKGARIGADCNIGEHCYIENDVVIGNRAVIKNGIALWDGITIENDVLLGPNVALTNDLLPRAKTYLDEPVRTLIRRGASIGANATLLCGITVGSYAMIGAGAVATRSVADYALVYGNPATLKGFVCQCSKKLVFDDSRARCECGREFTLSGDNVVAYEGEHKQ